MDQWNTEAAFPPGSQTPENVWLWGKNRSESLYNKGILYRMHSVRGTVCKPCMHLHNIVLLVPSILLSLCGHSACLGELITSDYLSPAAFITLANIFLTENSIGCSVPPRGLFI